MSWIVNGSIFKSIESYLITGWRFNQIDAVLVDYSITSNFVSYSIFDVILQYLEFSKNELCEEYSELYMIVFQSQ